jgi:hypothetical protein
MLVAKAFDMQGATMVFRRHSVPIVAIAMAAALSGCGSGASIIAQPDPMDFCAQALHEAMAGMPWIDIPGGVDPGALPPMDGSSVSINSGNNVSIQSGPNNVSINSSNVGGSANNGNNSFSCCVNGRCCVSSSDGPTACRP